MARKDDRIWTKCFLFIYAKICVNVKCHLDHALFMVWLFFSLKKKKKKKKKKHVGLKFSSDCVWLPRASERRGELGQWNDPGIRVPGVGVLPESPACSDLGSPVRHCLSFSAARNHAYASPWIEGCAACKIPKDNFIYSCCKQCLYKVY